MNSKTEVYTEYAINVNNDKCFVRQIDVLNSYEEAEFFAENHTRLLNEGEYCDIVRITYDCYGNEISIETVW